MFMNALLSIAIHTFILIILVNKFSFIKEKNKPAIETKIVIKSKNPKKNLLPKKMSPPNIEPLKVKKISQKKIASKKVDYSEILKGLSNDFKKDITEDKSRDVEREIDGSYYDQIYTLIKQSFVVPPHVVGPLGDNLKALVKIFIDENGKLLKVELKTASLDDHFNKAVLDGIKRIEDFGIPPSFMKKSLTKDGIEVALCPNKCH